MPGAQKGRDGLVGIAISSHFQVINFTPPILQFAQVTVTVEVMNIVATNSQQSHLIGQKDAN